MPQNVPGSGLRTTKQKLSEIPSILDMVSDSPDHHAKEIYDATLNVALTKVTSPAQTVFTQADVGKIFCLVGAGPALAWTAYGGGSSGNSIRSNHYGTITGLADQIGGGPTYRSAVLSTPASQQVTDYITGGSASVTVTTRLQWGHDNLAAATAVNAAYTRWKWPVGRYMLSGSIPLRPGTYITGDNRDPTAGSVIYMASNNPGFVRTSPMSSAEDSPGFLISDLTMYAHRGAAIGQTCADNPNSSTQFITQNYILNNLFHRCHFYGYYSYRSDPLWGQYPALPKIEELIACGGCAIAAGKSVVSAVHNCYFNAYGCAIWLDGCSHWDIDHNFIAYNGRHIHARAVTATFPEGDGHSIRRNKFEGPFRTGGVFIDRAAWMRIHSWNTFEFLPYIAVSDGSAISPQCAQYIRQENGGHGLSSTGNHIQAANNTGSAVPWASVNITSDLEVTDNTGDHVPAGSELEINHDFFLPNWREIGVVCNNSNVFKGAVPTNFFQQVGDKGYPLVRATPVLDPYIWRIGNTPPDWAGANDAAANPWPFAVSTVSQKWVIASTIAAPFNWYVPIKCPEHRYFSLRFVGRKVALGADVNVQIFLYEGGSSLIYNYFAGFADQTTTFQTAEVVFGIGATAANENTRLQIVIGVGIVEIESMELIPLSHGGAWIPAANPNAAQGSNDVLQTSPGFGLLMRPQAGTTAHIELGAKSAAAFAVFRTDATTTTRWSSRIRSSGSARLSFECAAVNAAIGSESFDEHMAIFSGGGAYLSSNFRTNLKTALNYIFAEIGGICQTTQGGTGANYATFQALVNGIKALLGLLFTDIGGTAAVTQGGTGAANAFDARTNLGVYSKAEVDNLLALYTTLSAYDAHTHNVTVTPHTHGGVATGGGTTASSGGQVDTTTQHN